MRKFLIAAVVGILALAMPVKAGAALITYQGQGILNSPHGTMFGLSNFPSAFTFSFEVDTAQASIVSAGTALSSSGAYFPQDIFLYDSSEITNFTFNFGTSSWTSADLLTLTLGTLGFTREMLISGDPLSPAGFQFALDDSSAGFLLVGQFNCTPECSILPQGQAFDYDRGVDGVTSSHTLIATSAVPESATWAMMIFGFGAIGGLLRARRRPKEALSLI